MKFIKLALVAIMLLSPLAVMAEGKITGKVVDKQSGEPISYAQVSIHKVKDSALVNGGVTNDNGNFTISKIPNGTYLVRIAFMGYQTYYHPTSITLSETANNINLGKIKLKPSTEMLDAVEVTSERTMVEYKLDKRVINVDKNIVTGGGSATDVLENVPSVALDSDGNVTLRGSSNVKVLINGRPYELLGSDLATLLEQIPATTVENVEVITNPSAKYDPEGMSGIINLKLKDNNVGALGWNGIVNLNAGTPLWFGIPDNMPQFIPTTMGSINLNYGTEKFTFTLSADAGLRSRGNTSTSYFRRYNNGIQTSEDSLFQSGLNSHNMGSVKAGIEYRINKFNSINLSYQLRGGSRNRMSQVDRLDLLTNGYLDHHQADTNLFSNSNHLISLNYTKKFEEKDRLLTFDGSFSRRRGMGTGWQEQRYLDPAANYSNYYLRETGTNNYHNTVNLQLNYTHPLNEKMRIETGYEGRMTFLDQNYDYYMTTYDPFTLTLNKELDSLSTTNYIYNQQVHAVYATYAAQITDKLSAQAGLRGEYSYIGGEDILHPTTTPVSKPYWQLYPTVHFSYEINKDQSLQLSYSRRVQRPHMWDLRPYLEVREGEQLSFGNPGLDPEFTNAFELSYSIGFKQTNIFSSLYFRQTNNMMTRYGFVWNATSAAQFSPWMNYTAEYDGYWASTWQNLNQGINAGLELILDQQITKWWKINASVNLYQSYIEGTELLNNTDRKAFRASGKLSSYMNLPKDWTIQLSGQYRAPFMDLQTDMMESYWADLAIKKDLWQKRATLSLRVEDVFCTGGFGHTTDNEQLYRIVRSKRLSPVVTVGFSYKINKGLQQKPKMEGMEEESFGE